MHSLTELRWLFGAVYFVIAFLAWHSSASSRAGERRLWLAIAAALVLFGISKALNLEEAVLDRVRSAAQREHWYDWHKVVQLAWLFLLAATAATCFAALVPRLKSTSANGRTAAIATGLLAAFIAIRCASIHLVDEWVVMPVAGLRLGWWIEVAALIVIGIAAGASRHRANAEAIASPD